jgi:hypothetical protein
MRLSVRGAPTQKSYASWLATVLNGTFEFESAPGRGTAIRVVIALRRSGDGGWMARTELVKVILVTLSGLMCAGGVSAQSAFGSVRGSVHDEQNGLVAGASITATAADVPGSFAVRSEADGSYRLTELPPGTYTIAADSPHLATFTRTPVIVRAGLNVRLDIEMKVGTVGEFIEVRADPPLLETRLPVQAINIGGEYQRSVPILPRRNWADFMALTPGVTVGTNNIALFFYVHGVDFDEHVIQLDGTDIASGQQNQLSYISLNADALKDVQIKLAGVDASTQMGYGAVINAVTQSGTNKFRGSASLLVQPRSWNDANVPGGASTTSNTYESDFSAGGPILRDRLWYFGTYRHYSQMAGVSRTPDQIATLQALVSGFQALDAASAGNFYFAKATAALASSQRVEGFFERDLSPQEIGLSTAGANIFKRIQGGNAASTRWLSVWTNALSTRVSWAYNDKSLPTVPYRTDVPSRNVYTSTVLSGGRLTGAGLLATLDNTSNWQDAPYRKLTLAADANYYAKDAAGTHEFQAGGLWQPVHEEFAFHYPADGFSLEDDVLKDPAHPAAGVVPFHRQIFDVSSVTSARGRSRNAAVYVQDTWQPGSRLTANVGVRVEFVDRRDEILNVTSEHATQFAPRAGVTYLLSERHNDAIRATWARLHEVMAEGSASAGATAAGFRDLYDSSRNGSFSTVFTTPASSAVAADRAIDPQFHQPYVNEASFGYRRQLPSLVSLDVSYAYRETRDRPVLIDTNGIYANGAFQGYRNQNLNQIYLVTNNQWNRLVYSGLDLSIAKQGGRLQWLASYNHQWRHVAGTWVPNDPASFIQPDAFANDKGIGNTRGPLATPVESNSLSGTYMAGSGQWRDNAFSLSANVLLPWGTRVAPVVTYQSGLWSGPVVTRIATPDPTFGPTTLVLGNGRLVSNPLATTIRFAYPTRGDGQWAPKGMYSVNLQVSREFAIGRNKLVVSLAGFNLTNYDAPLQLASGANQQFSTFYQQGTIVQQPRIVQALFRLVLL